VTLLQTAGHGAAARRARKPRGAADGMGQDKVVTAANGMCSRWKAMPDWWALAQGDEVANKWTPLKGISRFK
jgi:hypothetical protein